MSVPAVPAPPPASRLGASARQVRRHRIIERALRGWSTTNASAGSARTRRGPRRAGSRPPARAQPPARLAFAGNPMICLDRPRIEFPNISKPKGSVGRRGPGRRSARGAGRRRARDRARFPFACNPLISLDPPRNVFPNVSTTKGFVGRCGRRRSRQGAHGRQRRDEGARA